MQFRYARHRHDIYRLIDFYSLILNFEILGEFKNHSGYDGVMLGLKDVNWHLEFIQNYEKPQAKFDEDDALVFYPKTKKSFEKIVENLNKFKVRILQTKNPYWKNKGVCFEDCDGYKIIVCSENIEK